MTKVFDNLIDPIIMALHRHATRLDLLAQTDRPGICDELREESAHICENDIQNIVKTAYQTIVDAEPNPAKKIILLADSQKQLKDLLNPRLPQVNNRPHEACNTIFLQGSVAAARAVYMKFSQVTNSVKLDGTTDRG